MMATFQWRENAIEVLKGIADMYRNAENFDVTLHCEGGRIECHKILLAAVSPYFKNLIKEHFESKTIPLKAVKKQDLEKLFDFIHCGTVEVPISQVSSFIETAKLLQISPFGKDVGSSFSASSDLNEDVCDEDEIRNGRRGDAVDAVKSQQLRFGENKRVSRSGLHKKRISVVHMDSDEELPSAVEEPCAIQSHHRDAENSSPVKNSVSEEVEEVAPYSVPLTEIYVVDQSFNFDSLEPLQGAADLHSEFFVKNENEEEEESNDWGGVGTALVEKRSAAATSVTMTTALEQRKRGTAVAAASTKRRKQCSEAEEDPLQQRASGSAVGLGGVSVGEISYLKRNQEKMWGVLGRFSDTVAEMDKKNNEVLTLMKELHGNLRPATYPEEGGPSIESVVSRLPVGPDDFDQFDVELKDPVFKSTLMRILMMLDGKDVKTLVYRILRKLIRDEVGEQYSLTGRPWKEGPVKKTFTKTETFFLVSEVCHQKHRAGEMKIREGVSDWLMQAKFRRLRRTKRKTAEDTA